MTTRSPNDSLLIDFTVQKFDELVAVVASLTDEQANYVLPVPGSNSAIQLLSHCCGMMRRWSSTVNRGVTVPRDRAAEFTVQMPVAQGLELAAATRTAFLEDLALTDLTAPSVALPAERAEPWFDTCGGVILHVFEELCQHLGQLEITVDLARANS
ncbi:DinB family protein [Glutamicibacter endophyticus]|uniref:DinB family protein n=1 Tax=Glutamicibacter endophyticus TaxID=1522174 RepID=UPI003AF00A4B